MERNEGIRANEIYVGTNVGTNLEKNKTIKMDNSLKLNPVHMAILKEAQNNGGIYDRHSAVIKINYSICDDKLKKQQIQWNLTNLKTLEKLGYLIKVGNDQWKLNVDIKDITKKKTFVPGRNHVELLKKNKGGAISAKLIVKSIKCNSIKEEQRQLKIAGGMIRKLYANGYLEKGSEKGEYLLNKKAEELLEAPLQRQAVKKPAEFKITYFDRHIREVVDKGIISKALLEKHPKCQSIKKRIATLEREHYIEEGRLTQEFLKALERVELFVKENSLTLNMFTKEQMQILVDMRIFLNLSFTQIAKYIYNGDKMAARIDLDFLVKKKVLKKDEYYKVYVFDALGIKLSNEYHNDSDLVKYHSKLYSRTEEIEHDMLVYTAYQEWKKKLEAAGGQVIGCKNDRQMRSEQSKRYGHMSGGLPDLRIWYKLKGENAVRLHDIEIDCGYDGKTIVNKFASIQGSWKSSGSRYSSQSGKDRGNASSRMAADSKIGAGNSGSLGWYCSTFAQALKVMNKMADKSKVNKNHDKIKVYWIDGDGEVHEAK